MQPEHEQFLLEYMKQFGFFFIIDRLKEQFPKLAHEEACAIYKEFKTKHANDANLKNADSQLKDVGKKIGDEIEKLIQR